MLVDTKIACGRCYKFRGDKITSTSAQAPAQGRDVTAQGRDVTARGCYGHWPAPHVCRNLDGRKARLGSKLDYIRRACFQLSPAWTPPRLISVSGIIGTSGGIVGISGCEVNAEVLRPPRKLRCLGAVMQGPFASGSLPT